MTHTPPPAAPLEARDVYSTTGTAPLHLMLRGDGTVFVALPDGSGQVYDVADLLAALGVAP